MAIFLPARAENHIGVTHLNCQKFCIGPIGFIRQHLVLFSIPFLEALIDFCKHKIARNFLKIKSRNLSIFTKFVAIDFLMNFFVVSNNFILPLKWEVNVTALCAAKE